ncbi:PA3715 family protein [Kiloniella litopenaei]|uniref:hypothetical protein n=1 Tax=Kiloniella litopenaei TaxID=1549748 RepID=UPI000695D1C6|nr:hypothetical protein [Kiloniella litopenaei]
MEIILILFLILLLIGILLLGVRLFVWISKGKIRIQTLCVLLVAALIGVGGNHFFLKNMSIIQSKVYPDLYLIQHPEKEKSPLLHQAIREQVKQHMSIGLSASKKLAYQKKNSIFFYEYYKAFPISVFQDEGTAYFLENEEDLGGLVTEELGMYTKYKLAEFHYFPCNDNLTQYCGELEYFNENGVIKSESLHNLAVIKHISKNVSPGFDKDSVHALNNDKMHIAYDLFANELAIKHGDTIHTANSTKLRDDTLISSVINALDIAPSSVKNNLIALKTNPKNPNEAIVIIPEIVDEGEQYFDLNSHIVLANHQTGEITHKYFESSKTNQWVSDAIELKEISIDTAPYRMTEDLRAFGVRVRYSGMSRVNPYTSETLSLFIKSNNGLKKVLDAYPVFDAVGRWDGNCSGEFTDTENIFIVSDQKSNGFFDLKIKSHITTTIDDINTDGECDTRETLVVKTKKLKFDGVEYKLIN